MIGIFIGLVMLVYIIKFLISPLESDISDLKNKIAELEGSKYDSKETE